MAISSISADRSFATNFSLYQENDHDKPIQGDEPAQQSSLSSKIVEWIRADRPFYQQMVVYSIVAIAAIALIVSGVGLILVADVADENKKQEEAERLRLLDQPIIALLGGQSAYNQLSTLRFNNRDASYPASCPQLKEMTSSKMRGTDKYNRPVLFLKIFDKATRTTFVEMIYRKYSKEGSDNPWVKNPTGEKSIFEGELVIEGRALQNLDQVLSGKHSRYAIARR